MSTPAPVCTGVPRGLAIVPTESAHGWLDGHTPVLIRIARNTDALRSVGTLHAAYMALAMLSECEHVRFGLWVHWERQVRTDWSHE